MTFKKLIGQLHLWLGLSSGIVVFIIAITGALWAFETEISDLIYPFRTVQNENKAFLPPSKLIAAVEPYFKGKKIRSIQYPAFDKAATLSHRHEENGQDYHITAYVNPYTAQVLHVTENEKSFFDIVIELHVNLMLGKVGGYIVDYATLIFVVLLLSGIVLWWPKNKSAAKQRFWFKWKEDLKWKRKNYDLHNILGFYSSFIIIFVAITGLAWGFEWMDRAIQNTANLSLEYTEWEEPKSVSTHTLQAVSNIEDAIFYRSISEFGKPYEAIYMYAPDEIDEAFSVYVCPNQTTWYNAANYSYDQRTAQLLKTDTWESRNRGEKVNNMYYDIHIGKILGLTGQFMVFFASLIVASLPFTGFYIWWGRKSKKAKKLKNSKKAINKHQYSSI